MMKTRAKEELNNLLYNIKWLRMQHRLSEKQMAEILGIGVGSLQKIEKGTLPPRLSVNIVFEVQNYFGIQPKDLFFAKFGYTKQ